MRLELLQSDDKMTVLCAGSGAPHQVILAPSQLPFARWFARKLTEGIGHERVLPVGDPRGGKTRVGTIAMVAAAISKPHTKAIVLSYPGQRDQEIAEEFFGTDRMVPHGWYDVTGQTERRYRFTNSSQILNIPTTKLRRADLQGDLLFVNDYDALKEIQLDEILQSFNGFVVVAGCAPVDGNDKNAWFLKYRKNISTGEFLAFRLRPQDNTFLLGSPDDIAQLIDMVQPGAATADERFWAGIPMAR